MRKFLTIVITCFLPLFMVKSQRLLKDFGNNRVTNTAIAFTPDGKYMIVGGYAKSYDMTIEDEYFRTIKKDNETTDDLAFHVAVSPDNRFFLLTKLNRIEIWDIHSQTRIELIRDNRLSETAACFSRDGKDIIYLRKSGEIVFVSTSDFREHRSKKISGSTPLSVNAAPDGKRILVGTKGNGIIVYDIHTQDMKPGLMSEKEIRFIEFSPDGLFVAASTSDGRVWLGSYPSMETFKTWQAHPVGLTPVSFHPSGKYLATGGKDKRIRIWNIPDGSRLTEWEAHKDILTSLAFSPDGEKLASGSQNTMIGGGTDTRLWSFEASKEFTASVKESKQGIPSVKVETFSPQVVPGNQKRLALVIGNGNYPGSALANPENDARAMKNALAQFGFDVIQYENLNQSQMKMAMDQFGEKLKSYDVGLFFYAGHGIQAKGYNYLIPVDANLRSEEQVEYDCVQADRVLGLMEASGTSINIIILDACRNNPFERSWTRSASGRGLAYMDAPGGTLIAYATAPGRTASDGSGQNGLYTSAILESIRIPDITILQMFQNVRGIVSQKSNKEQIPWESTSLTGDFYFYKTGTDAK